MSRFVRVLIGVVLAALAGGATLAVELTLFFLVERITEHETIWASLAGGLLSGGYSALFFVVGLAVIGLPVLWLLGRAGRLNAVTASLAGAIGATGVVLSLMLASGVTDPALFYGLYLIAPGAAAGWVLWRQVFRPSPGTAA